jgi:EmrB/QacA subfamily drug resistance transporter
VSTRIDRLFFAVGGCRQALTMTSPSTSTSSTVSGDVAADSEGSMPMRAPWLMLGVLLAGQFMGLLDVMIVNVALPTIGTDLSASGAALQLVAAGYTVSYAVLLVSGARLGDLYGRRRLYLIGILGFTLTSLACGLAPTTGTLIAARFVQGAAAAMMVPQIISIIQARFAGVARAKAFSAYTAVLAVGAVAGQVVGGVLVSADLFGSGWRSVFLVNVPIGIAVAVLLPRVMPVDHSRGVRRLDLLGLAVIVPAVLLVVLPLVLGNEEGWPPWTFVALAVGVALLPVFVAVERRTTRRGGDPLLDLRIVRMAGVGSGMATLALLMIAYAGWLFSLAIHLQQGLGASALRSGLTFVPAAGAFGLLGLVWRRIPERVHHTLVPAGQLVAAAGFLAIGLSLQSGTRGGVLLLAALLVVGLGLGAAFSPLLTQSLVQVPPTRAADASGLLTTTLQLSQVIGVAVFGSVFLAGARHHTPNASATAISTTMSWLAVVLVVGAGTGLPLARTVLRARRAAVLSG